jgi:TonB family protein
MSLNNVLTYSLQIGLLIGVAGWIPAAARLRSPKARLAFFHALLVACLLLPALRPWKSEVIALEAPVTLQHATTASTGTVATRASLDPAVLIFALLAAGIVARLGMLALGMLRLRRYRLRSLPLASAANWSSEADIRVSPDISGPVTFGLARPVILLPSHFPDLPAEMRDAILCHETLHVRRRDWLFTAIEEFIRAGLWFHPAIWWLLGEIQLTREQAVDREAVGMTNAREPYVDALLAAAGAALEADLAPAPLFLRKRHLKQRVVSILKEKQMSKTRTMSTLAAGLAILAGTCWFVTGALPLSADPQLIPDGNGVTVDLMGAQVIHRSPVYYSRDALAKKVEGVVVAQVKLDDSGNVVDASILSGPDDLRKPVLQSLLSWHFTKDAAGGTRQVSVKFSVPEPVQAPAGAVIEPQSVRVAAPQFAAVANPIPKPVTPPDIDRARLQTMAQSFPNPAARTIRSITVEGLGIPADEVLAKLPLHVDDEWTPEGMSKLQDALHQIDEHLTASLTHIPPSGVGIRITASRGDAMAVSVEKTAPPVPGVVNVGGRVQANKLISNPQPVYPDLARQARISGVVSLQAVIAPDGHMQQLTVISGHPLLRQAALDAVKQWVYQPTLLNGQPVSVATTVDVIFTLEN